MYSAKLVAVGKYLPTKVLDNHYFQSTLDTSDEWITERTGIKQRHIASDDQLTSDLAVAALQNALNASGIEKNSIDGIIVATTTPDLIFPSVATIVQNKIGMANHCFTFDLNGVCTGFVHALTVADSMIKTGVGKRIAVIGAETMSRILDWEDRSTVVLFGDGAGAFILERSESLTPEDRCGVLDAKLYSEGSLCDVLYVSGGPSSIVSHPTEGSDGVVKMNGREVFKFAVNNGYKVTKEIVDNNDLSNDDIDYLIMHQANVRILDAVAKKLGLDSSKIVKSVANHANTSAASIPLAFAEKFGNTIPHNKNIIFTGFGAGMSWGSIYFKV